jgi:SAM-dependent methyltransferase
MFVPNRSSDYHGMVVPSLHPDFKQFPIPSGERQLILLPYAAMTSNTVSDIPLLRGPVPLSRLFVRCFVSEGDRVIDATCGNGHDTLALAERTGSNGRVWGFDIQEQAIAETGRRLSEAGLADRVTLVHAGHEEMAQHLNGPVKLVLFNLGYLPGGDRRVITRPATTGIALDQTLKLLAVGGIVIVTVYPGHEGGGAEQKSVDDWANALDPREYHSWRMGQVNVVSDAPYTLLVQKAA